MKPNCCVSCFGAVLFLVGCASPRSAPESASAATITSSPVHMCFVDENGMPLVGARVTSEALHLVPGSVYGWEAAMPEGQALSEVITGADGCGDVRWISEAHAGPTSSHLAVMPADQGPGGWGAICSKGETRPPHQGEVEKGRALRWQITPQRCVLLPALE